MRIILQERNTQLYLKDLNQWTENKNEAKDFSSITEAEKLCQENDLDVVALALRGDHIYKLHLNCEERQTRSQKRHP